MAATPGAERVPVVLVRAGKGRFRRPKTKTVLVYTTVAVYLVVVLIPLYWMFRSSISENAEMYGTAIQFFPSKFTLAQFEAALGKWQFGLYLRNSLIVALLTTFLTTVMASLAAYSLVRL